MTSFSNVDRVIVTHYSMEWTLSFEAKTFCAVVELTLQPTEGTNALETKEIILDTLDLTVTHAEMIMVDTWQPAPFRFCFSEHKYHHALGSALHVWMGPTGGVPQKLRLRYYSTSSHDFLLWNPSPSINCIFVPNYLKCRKVMPMQDTIGARFTYDVTIALPRGTTCVMPCHSVVIVDEVGMQRQWLHWRMRQLVPLGPHHFFFAIGQWECASPHSLLRVMGPPLPPESVAFHAECLQEVSALLGGPPSSPTGSFVHTVVVVPASFPYPQYSGGGVCSFINEMCLQHSTPRVILSAVVDVLVGWVSPRSAADLWVPAGIAAYVENSGALTLRNFFRPTGDQRDGEIDGHDGGARDPSITAYADLRHLVSWMELDWAVRSFCRQRPPGYVVKFPGACKDPHEGLASMSVSCCCANVMPCALTSVRVVPRGKASQLWRHVQQSLGDVTTREIVLKLLEQGGGGVIGSDTILREVSPRMRSVEPVVDWAKWLYSAALPPVVPNFCTTLTDSVLNIAEYCARRVKEEKTEHEVCIRAAMQQFSELQLVVFLLHLTLHSSPLADPAMHCVTRMLKACRPSSMTPLVHANWHVLRIVSKRSFPLSAQEFVRRYPVAGIGSIVLEAAISHYHSEEDKEVVNTFLKMYRASLPLVALYRMDD